MMQASDLRDRDHLSDPAWHDRAQVRTIFVKREMRAGALVIVDIRGQDTAQMALVKSARAPRRRTIYFAMFAWLTTMPSLSSSPWIRGGPHSGLALPSAESDCESRAPVKVARIWSAIAKIGGTPDDAIGRGRLDQHHHLQTTWPQSVEQNPEEPIYRDELPPARMPAIQDRHLVAQRDDQLH